MKAQNKLTLSYNYSKIVDTEAFGTRDKAGKILWRTKLPAVLTAQSSAVVKAVVSEPTN